MSYKQLEITINSAKGLKRAKHLHTMSVYAVVTISAADPLSEQRTPADKDGGRDPNWNHTMKFTIDEAAADQKNYLALDIKLKCHRSHRGDKQIGEVHVPVKELLDKFKAGDDCSKFVQYKTYQVKKPSGKPKGELNLSYKFEDIPVTAYPAHVKTSSPYPPPVSLPPKTGAAAEAYPPPPGCSGCNCSHPAPTTGHRYSPHGYPQHVAGYPFNGGRPPPTPPPGYPTQASGYGYPPLVKPQQPLHINSVGLELGIGIIGGMLGGLLIGEMVPDASDHSDAASE